MTLAVEEANEKTTDIVADVESGGKESIGKRLVIACQHQPFNSLVTPLN